MHNYSQEKQNVLEAQRKAFELTFGAFGFQITRLMLKFNILQILIESKNGLDIDEIVKKTKLSKYACKCLMESSLTIGMTLLNNGKFTCSKMSWFLLNDPLISINMEINHNLNYLGLYHLEEALLSGKPAGLKVFGKWDTLYEGLSEFPENVRNSWLKFNDYFSASYYNEALEIVFANNPQTLLDVGGNTGKWALQCVNHNKDVRVTVMDLPQQIELMQNQIAEKSCAIRILGHACNFLHSDTCFPAGFDVIWMSQFLTCFSEDEIINILSKVYESMNENTLLYIMEMYWDRQRFETATYTLTQISLYFTALANGNSKIYHSDDMFRCIKETGLVIKSVKDGLGLGHTLVVCRKNKF